MASLARLSVNSRMGSARTATHAAAASRLAAVNRHLSSRAGMSTPQEDLVLFENHMDSRVYKLNRPAKLNSLNHEMIKSLSAKIENWRDLKACALVIGAGNSRAFCAGGDVKQIVLDMKEEKQTGIPFFKNEFQLNWTLARLGKPYVVFIDGITMGGGAGLSLPANIRIATHRTVFAMPETKIGYSPDVGASYYLSQLDGYVGAWLAVTGQELYGRAVYELGIATHYVTENTLEEIMNQITQHTNPTAANLSSMVSSFTATSTSTSEPSSKSCPDGPSPIKGDIRKFLDKTFNKQSVQEIHEALVAAENNEALSAEVKDWAKIQKAHIEARSPTGMSVALYAYHAAKKAKRLDRTLLNDMSMATAYVGPERVTDDFITGVSAVLIDRSKEPTSWSPSSLSDPSFSPSSIGSRFFNVSKNTKDTKDKKPALDFVPKSASKLDSGRDSTWGKFRKYGLPSEEAVRAAVDGYAPGSGAFALTKPELLEHFIDEQGDVRGPRRTEVEERVKGIMSTCCKVNKEGYLQWTA